MSGTEPVAPEMPPVESAGSAELVGVQTDKWMRWMIAIAVMTSAVMELVDTKPVWPLPLQQTTACHR